MRLWFMGTPMEEPGGAFLPSLPVTPRASTYRQVMISGQPGTLAISAPKPNSLVPISQTRDTQGSYRSPDVIYPSVYYTTPDNMHPPMGLQRDNQMPVPAVSSWGRVGNLKTPSPLPAMKRIGVGGNAAIGWPATVPRWGNRAGKAFSG